MLVNITWCLRGRKRLKDVRGNEVRQRCQKRESGIELMFKLRVGLSFLMSKLFLMRSQLEEEEEERILKSSEYLQMIKSSPHV